MVMKGRKAKPLKGIDDYDFAKLSKTKGTPRERRRFLAFAHLQDGKSFSESARMIKVSPRTVIVWAQKFRENGLDGLLEKSGRGAKSYVASEDYEDFIRSVEELQSNRIGGRIRGMDVCKLIEEKYGKKPSLSTTYRILRRVGLVWITGRSQHPKSDIKAQEAFKKTSEAKLKK